MKTMKLLLVISCFLAGFTGFSQTQQNNALSFDGTNDYVAIPHNVALDFSRGFTVEAWAYPESNDGGFFAKKHSNTSNGFLLDVYSLGNFSFYLISPNSWSILRSSTTVPLNAWVHLAATYDNSTMKVYVNGVLRGSRSASTIVGNSNSAVELGRFDDILDSGNNTYLDGSLDEVRIWDKVLTAEEILAQKDCKIPTNTSGLVAYYDFNQGTANGGNNAIATLTDIGGNGLNGTLTNFAKTGNTSNFVSGVTGAFNNEDCSLLSVTTSQTTNITSTSATLNGNMTSNGGATITERGFVYSTSNTDLTTANTAGTVAVNGTETGAFSVDITGLTANTEYHYRAYAKNDAGSTVYGDIESFTTLTTAPTVSTTSVSNITYTSAALIGSMTSDGGETITKRGFVYSTSNADLTTANTAGTIAVSGTGTGVFSGDITGLRETTQYYYRAYATNIAGTSYGDVESFTTTSTDADVTMTAGGIPYPTENIGAQVWTSENMKHGSGAGISSYDDDENNDADGYGKLYTWAAVMDGSTEEGAQGICAIGWHIPTRAEWSAAGSGFNEVRLAGLKLSSGGYLNRGRFGLIWNSSTIGLNMAWQATFGTGGYEDVEESSKTNFLSVRCVRDLSVDVLSNEDFELSGVSISPNPTSGILNIAIVEKAGYRLLNIRGQVLKRGVLATGEGKIDISSFAKGVYFLNLKTDKGNFTEKVVKE